MGGCEGGGGLDGDGEGAREGGKARARVCKRALLAAFTAVARAARVLPDVSGTVISRKTQQNR